MVESWRIGGWPTPAEWQAFGAVLTAVVAAVAAWIALRHLTGHRKAQSEQSGPYVMVDFVFAVFVGSHAPETMLDADLRRQGQLRDRQVRPPSHQVESLGEQGVQLLSVLGEQDLSRSELLGALGLGNETRNVRRHIDPLLGAGLVERTIVDRRRSSLQRYRITDLGRATSARQEGTS